jgi:hypothetical protein
LLVAYCWAGHYLVMDRHHLSRDEQMAVFDAAVFAGGRLSWPIPEAWRPFVAALNQTFILHTGGGEGWVSAYLPVNAMFRAAVGSVADDALTAPLFVGAGALALWRIGLRLWPDSPRSRAVALVLYAGSAQVLTAGMTAYAMSAHLGLNLLWLALFLRGGRAGHGGALGVGFLATGLHQPIFHPLFALPFLLLLFSEGRWRTLGLHLPGYASICAFWLAWPTLVDARAVEIATSGGAAMADAGYVTRLLAVVRPPDPGAVWLMAVNLLRFAAWQHLLLPVLLALGALAMWRAEPVARALALGLALPVLAMAVLLPYQGHGWGYRYVHGVIGNACLLGAYGWRWLEARGLSFRGPLLWTSAATFLAALPAHAFLAHRMVEPFAAAQRSIANARADVVVVDDEAAPFAADLVINPPDLSDRPTRLRGSALEPEDMAALCRRGTMRFFAGAELHPIGALFHRPAVAPTEHLRALAAAARREGC